MKALNEFQSVLVIASLILASCAAIGLLFAAPEAGASKQDNGYSAYGVTRSFDAVRHNAFDMVDAGAAIKPVSVVGLEAGNSPGHASILLTRLPGQARTSW